MRKQTFSMGGGEEMSEDTANFCLAVTMCTLIVSLFIWTLQVNRELHDVKDELARLKAECIAKHVAEYGFNNKGEIVFKIKEQTND